MCWAGFFIEIYILGGEIGPGNLHSGIAAFDTPIWDDLPPKGKQDEVGGCLRMGSRSPASQLGKRYQMGVLRL